MNKNFKIIGIIILIVIAVLALLNLNKSERTDWRKNFDINKKTPFGLFVFNKEANHLLHNKLKKVEVSPFEYYDDNKTDNQNILLIQAQIDFESWNEILKKVNSGSDLLLISEYFDPYLADILGFKPATVSYRAENILRLTDEKFNSDSIILDKSPEGQGFSHLKDTHEILGKAEFDGGKVNFIKIDYGKGHIYVHSEPLFLTNYYLLKPGNEKYTQDVFSYFPNRETIWFSGVSEEVAESRSPMRFILSKPALKYAWWVLLGSLLLFVFFNVKRKQRIVPIEEPLKNKSVEFVKSIGNLYMQEGDFHDMMAKKAQYFLNRIRTELLIDTQNLDENFVHILHLKTGTSREKIIEAIDYIQRAQDPYATVMKDELGKMNKLLDEILR